MTLSPQERSKIWQDFSAYADQHPLQIQQNEIPRAWHFAMQPLAYATLFLIIISGGALSYASEDALPRDPLYFVKREVNERFALATTSLFPDAYAKTNIRMVERRLEEAETLVLERKADPIVLAELSEDIVEHSEKVRSYSSSSEDTEIHNAHEASSDLENTLEAHAIILQAVSETQEDQSDIVSPFITRLASTSELAEDVREEIQEKIEESEYGVEPYLAILTEDLSNVLEDIESTRIEHGTSSPFNDERIELIEVSEAARKRGEALLKEGETGEAFREIHDALQNAHKAERLLQRESELAEEND